MCLKILKIYYCLFFIYHNYKFPGYYSCFLRSEMFIFFSMNTSYEFQREILASLCRRFEHCDEAILSELDQLIAQIASSLFNLVFYLIF